MSRKQILAGILGVAVVAFGLMRTHAVRASDHDDGEIDSKGRALNLTDLYVFREDSETGGTDKNNIVYIMNTHPRSLPNQQYYYSSKARYEFHIARVGTDKSKPAATAENAIIRFEFGDPDANSQQSITMTTIVDGNTTVTTTDNSGATMKTTAAYKSGPSIASGGTTSAVAASPNIINTTVNGRAFKLFVGHRADPFFFNVTGFFKLRLATAFATTETDYVKAAVDNLLPTGTPATVPIGDDFTKQYNVSSIVVDFPIAFLQTGAGETVFDNWETISVRQ